MANSWIKLYIEILDDPKMARLSDNAWRRCIELFMLAGRQGESGRLPAIDDMAWTLRTSADELSKILELLSERGIVTKGDDGWTVTKFAERQGPSPVKQRVAEWRERQKAAEAARNAQPPEPPLPDDVPDGNNSLQQRYANGNACNAPDTDSDTDSESESERELSAPLRSLDRAGAQKMLMELTGWARVPGNTDDALNALGAIMDLHAIHKDDTLDYLRPFWIKFKADYPSSTKVFWLTEWAVQNVKPDKNHGKKKAQSFYDYDTGEYMPA